MNDDIVSIELYHRFCVFPLEIPVKRKAIVLWLNFKVKVKDVKLRRIVKIVILED